MEKWRYVIIGLIVFFIFGILILSNEASAEFFYLTKVANILGFSSYAGEESIFTSSNYMNYDYELIDDGYRFKIYFRNNTNTAGAVRFEKDGYFFTYDLSGGKMQWAEQPGFPARTDTLGGGAPSNSQDSQVTINQNEFNYPGAYYNTTVRYDVDKHNLKETFVLGGLPSYKDYTYLEYTRNIKFNASLKICANDICYIPSGTQDDFSTNGQIEFRDANDKVIFYLKEPVIMDSIGNSIIGNYKVKGSNAQMQFSLRINKTFLQTAVYPIFIDPSISIIQIKDAEHLDVNRSFISNIYNETVEKDDIWSETIGNGEYVRAVFEQPLNNEKDITLYVRSADSNNVTIEVYEVNSETLITSFEPVLEEIETKIYLTNISDDPSYTQDTFDLKVLSDGVGAEFDWIVDPLVSWVRPEGIYYDNQIPSATALITDVVASTLNVTFEWSINSINIENDTVLNVPNNTKVTEYLNSSINVGDIINISVWATNGTDNSTKKSFQYIILGNGGDTSPQPSAVNYSRAMDCDDTYCYLGHDGGWFSKVFKNGTVVLGIGGTEGGAVDISGRSIYGIDCDDTYCYSTHTTGYFNKYYKSNGTTSADVGRDSIKPVTLQGNDIFCDDTYCYMGHNNGWFTKVFKNGTIAIGNGGTESESVQPNGTNFISDVFCDDTYCYNGHGGGTWFTKVFKNGTIAIGNGGTESEAVKLSVGVDGTLSAIYCDDTYCYGGLSNGYFSKVFKNGTIVFDDSDNIRPNTQWVYNIFCDDTYCYGGASNGYFSKVFKNGTIAIGTGGTESTALQLIVNKHMVGFDCDEYYCYGSHADGWFSKVLKSLTLVVQSGGTDTCTYTSGNWNVLCSDNCAISSNVNLGGNNISVTGTGTFTMSGANITNFKKIYIAGTDSSNRCIVRCLNGGCFKMV